jgi:hypothetical protein
VSGFGNNGAGSCYFPGDGAYHRIISKSSFKVSPGQNIFGSMQATRSPLAGAASLHFGLYFDNGTYDYFVAGLSPQTNTFKEYSGELIVPAGATSARVWIFNYTGNTAEAYVDDVYVGTKPRIAGQGAFALLDQIMAANISTYIAAAAIGEAYIGNAAVSMLKIEGEAVTLPRSYQNDAAMEISTGWQELATLTLDPKGQPILVDFSCFCDFYLSIGGLSYAYIQIVVNGIQEYIRPIVGLNGNNGPQKYLGVANIQAKILSSVGNNVVSIQFYSPNSIFDGPASYRYLNVLGVKR